MSIIAFERPSNSQHVHASDHVSIAPAPAAQPIRRRASLQQGRALETLGHAVEYLIDSRLFLASDFDQRDEHEAVQILMRMSRAVFAECPEAISLRRRFGRWVAERLARSEGVAQQG